MKKFAVILLLSWPLFAATTSTPATGTAKRIQSGANLPPSCVSSVLVKDFFWKNSDSLYICTSANTWTVAAGGANPAGSGSELQYRSGATTFGAITGSSVSGGSISGLTLVTPTIASFINATHNHTNAAGGGQLAESAFAFTDITTANATTSQHGLLPKLGGGTTNFLRADGTWAAPAGGVSGSGTSGYISMWTGSSTIGASTAFTTTDSTVDWRIGASATTQAVLGLQLKASQSSGGDALRVEQSDGTIKSTFDDRGHIFLSSDRCVGWNATTNASGGYAANGNVGLCWASSSRAKLTNGGAGYSLLDVAQLYAHNTSADTILLDRNAQIGFGGDVGLRSPSAGILDVTNDSTGAGWLVERATNYRVTTQFDATTTTLANVTGLVTTTDLRAGRSYAFEAVLHVTADATGGHKYAINCTCTATAIVYQINSINNATNAFRINSRQTSLGGSSGEAVGTAYFTVIRGEITVNAGGALAVQFAENTATGTSSVLVGSTFWIKDNT